MSEAPAEIRLATRHRARRWIAVALASLAVLLGAVLARHTRADLPLETLRARWATGSSRFMDLDGMQVHFRDEGSGPAIVLLHGTAASLHTWDGWADALAHVYRVIRLDLPAFGLTGPSPSGDYSIAAYVQFVDHAVARLGLGSFVLGGNSLGGNIAWHYALAHPDRVRGLVLVDAAGYPPASAPAPWAFRIARWPIVPWLLSALDPAPLVQDGLRKSYGDPARIRPGVLDRYVELSLRPGNRAAFIDRMRAPLPGGDAALIATLRVPTLILWGGRDRVIDPANGPRFAHDIPGARLVTYQDLGHIPMEEDPARTVFDVMVFLPTLGAVTPPPAAPAAGAGSAAP
jgi:pimeloyl-ACP methyl ester carboxylesterase